MYIRPWDPQGHLCIYIYIYIYIGRTVGRTADALHASWQQRPDEFVKVFAQGARYCTRSTFKPTELARPLGCDSIHHSTVHKMWPQNVVKQHFLLNSCYADAIAAKEVVVDRLIRYNTSEHIIALVRRVFHGCSPGLPAGQCNVWCVLPFHRIWCAQMLRVLQGFCASSVFRGYFQYANHGQEMRLRLSWRNFIVPMHKIIERHFFPV